MALKDLVIKRRAVAPVKLWAAVGTPKRGRRWIDWSTLSSTRDGCLRRFLQGAVPSPDVLGWAYWSAHGWTIERVVVSKDLAKTGAIP